MTLQLEAGFERSVRVIEVKTTGTLTTRRNQTLWTNGTLKLKLKLNNRRDPVGHGMTATAPQRQAPLQLGAPRIAHLACMPAARQNANQLKIRPCDLKFAATLVCPPPSRCAAVRLGLLLDGGFAPAIS
jgi:hypothetical protein